MMATVYPTTWKGEIRMVMEFRMVTIKTTTTTAFLTIVIQTMTGMAYRMLSIRTFEIRIKTEFRIS
jgi:hypothetical protein